MRLTAPAWTAACVRAGHMPGRNGFLFHVSGRAPMQTQLNPKPPGLPAARDGSGL